MLQPCSLKTLRLHGQADFIYTTTVCPMPVNRSNLRLNKTNYTIILVVYISGKLQIFTYNNLKHIIEFTTQYAFY